MSAYPPQEFNVPFHIDMIRSGDPDMLADYMHELWRGLATMQQQTSNSIYGVTEDFQPSIDNAAKSASIDSADYDVRRATYTRVGNLVWFTLEVHWTGADVTGTGDLIIRELPFKAKKNAIFQVFDDDNATDPVGLCQVAAGDKDLTDFVVGSATLLQVEDDHDLIITGVYLAES